MTAKTIQERLDDKASTALHGKLCKAFSAFRKAISYRAYDTVSISTKAGLQQIPCSVLLDALQKSIHTRQLDHYKQVATDAFLEQIGTIEKSVEQMEDALSAAHSKGKI